MADRIVAAANNRVVSILRCSAAPFACGCLLMCLRSLSHQLSTECGVMVWLPQVAYNKALKAVQEYNRLPPSAGPASQEKAQ